MENNSPISFLNILIALSVFQFLNGCGDVVYSIATNTTKVPKAVCVIDGTKDSHGFTYKGYAH